MKDKIVEFKLWDGGSSVMQIRVWSIILLAVFILAATSTVQAQTPPPRIFFTDLDTAPNSGGESVGGFSGAYVTIYGNFFGILQGTSTITWNGQNCLRVLPVTGTYTGWGMAHFWYQEIVVQLGASCTPGTGNFVVTTSAGASNGVPFTVRSIGSNHIYFVSTSGNDSNSGTISSPMRSWAGCKNAMNAGDICYIEGGVNQTSNDNFTACLDIESVGTAAQPYSMGAYPGATPQPSVGSSSCTYGIRVPDIGINANYWRFFGIKVNQSSGDRGVHTNGGTQNWRFVGNYVTCPNFNAQAGCFQTRDDYYYVYGNEFTNIGVPSGSGKESHSVYFGTDSSHIDAGWNSIHDNFTCRAIQFHSSPVGGSSGQDQFDLHVHDNIIHGDNCDGINFATVDPSKGTVEAYNNIIYHVGLKVPPDGGGNFTCIAQAGIVNNGPNGAGTLQVYNNTLYDCGTSLGQPQGFPNFGAIGNNNPPGMALTNNLVYQIGGEQYIEGNTYNEQALSGTNNLWFGAGGSPSGFLANLTTDPKFVSLGVLDFHLLPTSPTIGAGSATLFPAIDIEGKVRSNPPSIGAFEYAPGVVSVQKPNPPTGLTVVVH